MEIYTLEPEAKRPSRKNIVDIKSFPNDIVYVVPDGEKRPVRVKMDEIDSVQGDAYIYTNKGRPSIGKSNSLKDSISALFVLGARGSALKIFDTDTLFQDTSLTTLSDDTDTVGGIEDQSGNDGDHATQSDIARRPTRDGTRITVDGNDDNMSIDFTGSGEFNATLLHGTSEGLVEAKVNVPDGVWNFWNTIFPGTHPSNNVTGLVLVEGTPDVSAAKAEIPGAQNKFAGVTNMRDWFGDRVDIIELASGDWDTSSVTMFRSCFFACFNLVKIDTNSWDTSSVTHFTNFVRNCSSLITLDVSNWDTSNVTRFDLFAFSCTSLKTLDVSNWDTSNVTRFNNFVGNCHNLEALDVSNWDTSNVTLFNNFVASCHSLTTLDVSNWDTTSVTDFGSFISDAISLIELNVSGWNTSNVTDFSNFANLCPSLTTVTVNGGTGNPFADSPATDYTNAFVNTNLTQQSIDDILVAIEAAGTSNGTFDQSGGSAPSATGEAAVTSLRVRGWTVTVTGGF